MIRRVWWFLAALLLAMPVAAQDSVFTFDALEKSLKLTPYQKNRFDHAVRATQKAMVSIGLAAVQAKARLAGELLKDRPDPNALSMAQDELVEFTRPYVRETRDAWSQFYATLDDEQVRIARDAVEDKLRKLEMVGRHLAQMLAEQLQKR